jgi:hypothetical protein
MDSERTTSGRDQTPVEFYRLGDEPVDDLTASTTPEERLELLRELSDRAWRLTGRGFPSYSRREAPVRVTRIG